MVIGESVLARPLRYPAINRAKGIPATKAAYGARGCDIAEDQRWAESCLAGSANSTGMSSSPGSATALWPCHIFDVDQLISLEIAVKDMAQPGG